MQPNSENRSKTPTTNTDMCIRYQSQRNAQFAISNKEREIRKKMTNIHHAFQFLLCCLRPNTNTPGILHREGEKK